MSKILELLNTPWAINAEKLLQMQGIYDTHLRGEKIDVDALEAKMGKPLANEQQEYTIDTGVATLSIDGVIAPRMNMFTRISGGTSAQMLGTQLDSAMADPRVQSIILAIDSPGGSVHGSPEFATAVREAAAKKPIVAVGSAQMASAAYWIASAANAIYITGPTVQVGSIGVVATHDYSPNRSGGKTTEIAAGKFKRIASSEKPLSAEGEAYLQGQVDHIYSVFVDTVAGNRGVSSEAVLEHMADGRTFTGQQAIDAGLVDGVSTIDALVAKLAADPEQFTKRRVASFKAVPAPKESEAAGAASKDKTKTPATASDEPSHLTGETMETKDLTIDVLQRDNSALHASILAAGAQQERDRIQAVRSQSMPGHEALIDALAGDGKTTGPEAAMAVMAAMRESTAAAARAHAADAPAAAARSSASNDSQAKPKDKTMKASEAKAYAAENKVTFLAAMKALGHAA